MASNEMVQLLAEANNNFGLAIHLKLAEEQTNVFFSPFSLSVALTMLFRGAVDETAAEIKQVLCLERVKLSDEQVHLCFSQLLDVFVENQQFYTLTTANAIVVQKDIGLLPDYKSALESIYKALVMEVDFVTESSAALDHINTWVENHTNGKIRSVFESLDPSTVIILLNAVYFKGTWQQQFDPERTSDEIFYSKGVEDQEKTVPFMKISKKFLFVEKETYKVLELPYEGNHMAMLLFLPHEIGGLENLERSLSGRFVHAIREELVEVKVDVMLPKLHLEYSKEMLPILKALGMSKIFGCGEDLKGMTGSDDITVSNVIHKAVLDVNEEGSEAAAVTAIRMKRCKSFMSNPVFNANHPFLFVIYDKRNNVILFMGRVEEM